MALLNGVIQVLTLVIGAIVCALTVWILRLMRKTRAESTLCLDIHPGSPTRGAFTMGDDGKRVALIVHVKIYNRGPLSTRLRSYTANGIEAPETVPQDVKIGDPIFLNDRQRSTFLEDKYSIIAGNGGERSGWLYFELSTKQAKYKSRDDACQAEIEIKGTGNMRGKVKLTLCRAPTGFVPLVPSGASRWPSGPVAPE